MPQLDMLSWLNQVLTTTVVMFFFYALLSLVFLPNTSSMFKGRNKLQSFRKLSINFLFSQMLILIINISYDLSNILLNNMILVAHYFVPTNTLLLKNELELICYTAGFLDIGALYTNYYVANNLSQVLKNMEVSSLDTVDSDWS
jgi:hypothetical protein